MARTTAPYGSWRSPITARMAAAGTVGLSQVALDAGHVYWVEGRPAEGGRNVVVRRGAGGGPAQDAIPEGHSARTRVHEYGGGAFAADGGTVYYANFSDQRLYRHRPGGAPEALTPDGADLRYADLEVDRARGRLIAVREDHTAAGGGEARNEIVSVPARPGEGPVRVLASGADFYSSPRVSPGGGRLCWLQWNHPDMPWDGCELWAADLGGDGAVTGARLIAGGPGESIFQPEWSPGGALHLVSDRSGWWNLYRADERGDGAELRALCPMEAEFATPAWVFGMRTYGFAAEDRIVCAWTSGGTWSLGMLDARTGELAAFDLPYTDYSCVRVGGGAAVFRAGSAAEAPRIVRLDLAAGGAEPVSSPPALGLPAAALSAPEAIEFPTEGGARAHCLFYPPASAEFEGPRGERPPLVVRIHGGPTGAASSTLSMGIQYWTSRGFAVADVNYRGSTGYGTAYRRALGGAWGVADVDDCVAAARHLVARGDADGERLAIAGGSAGGFTTLAALTFRDVFCAGASYYGISDLEALARDTHKFESRYLDGLVAPYPERADVWRERSPINCVERLSRPVILFQGMEDRVVPPNQAEMIVEALRERGLAVAYVAYEGEQHGFRRAENIVRTLEGELYFYSRIFGFEPADPIEPVPIDNF